MPGVMTAEELVNEVREEVGILDEQTAVDGWPEDEGIFPKAPRILAGLNWALNDLIPTRFNICKFQITIQQLVTNYPMKRSAHEIELAWLEQNGTGRAFPLEKTSMEELTAEFNGPGWMNSKGARPTKYYNIGTKAFCIWPKPLNTSYKVFYYASTPVEDLVLRTDVPAVMRDSDGVILLDSDGKPMSDLPEEFHRKLVIGASAITCRRLQRRDDADRYFQEWNASNPEYGIKAALKAMVRDRQSPNMKRLELKNPYMSDYGMGIR